MTSEFDRFKTEGNRLLKAGEIEMAVVLYTSAAAAAESSRQAAIALGNRSLAQFRLENLAAAKADAEACIARDPTYEKGQARLRAADYELEHGPGSSSSNSSSTGGGGGGAAKPEAELTDKVRRDLVELGFSFPGSSPPVRKTEKGLVHMGRHSLVIQSR